VGEQTGDLIFGPLKIHYAVETEPGTIRLVLKLGPAAPYVADGSSGDIHIQDGSKSVNIRFEVHTTGLHLKGIIQHGDDTIGLDGYALYWPETLTIKPGLAQVVSKPRDDAFPGRYYIDAALRDPFTLKSLGIAFTRSTFPKGVVAEAHLHLNDTVRIIVSGRVRFTIDPPNSTPLVAEAGDVVNIPGGTIYKEEILEDSIIVTSRLRKALHYGSGK